MQKLLLIIFLIFVSLLQNINTADLNTRIVNGKIVKPGQSPYMISLSVHGSFLCGGSIISDRHILTASHCLDFGNNSKTMLRYVKVTAGKNRLSANTATKQVRALKQAYMLPNPSSDIAIIELNESLPINTSYIAKIALRNTIVPEHTWCTVSGWGVQANDGIDITNDLMAVNVSIVSFSRCYDMYEKIDDFILLDSVCAGGDYGDSCWGDSGGPLVCDGYLTGIVASGHECAHKDFPAIYTNVSMYAKWINRIVHSTSTVNNDKTGNNVINSSNITSPAQHIPITGFPASATTNLNNIFMSFILVLALIIMFCK